MDAGWEVINMTQYPEAYLCRELGMAVVNIALITDYDAGVHEGTEAVDSPERARGVLRKTRSGSRRWCSTSSGASRPTSTRSGRGTPLSSPRAPTATPTSQEDIRLFETGL